MCVYIARQTTTKSPYIKSEVFFLANHIQNCTGKLLATTFLPYFSANVDSPSRRALLHPCGFTWTIENHCIKSLVSNKNVRILASTKQHKNIIILWWIGIDKITVNKFVIDIIKMKWKRDHRSGHPYICGFSHRHRLFDSHHNSGGN